MSAAMSGTTRMVMRGPITTITIMLAMLTAHMITTITIILTGIKVMITMLTIMGIAATSTTTIMSITRAADTIRTTTTITARRTSAATVMTIDGRDAADPKQPDDCPRAAMEDSHALYRLMTWLSPSFPVGAFSYSSGIEWAVEAGDIRDAASLRDWLTSLLVSGAGFCDGVFLAHAWRATQANDAATLAEVAELATAFAPTRERHLETTAQGRAFVEVTRSTWPCAALDLFLSVWTEPAPYPVAVGVVSAGHGVPLEPTIHAFLHAQTANWISAGVRLVPLGQTDSQRVLAALEPVVAATAHRALTATFDDLGGASFRADIGSMKHETQYTRLFRS